MIGDHAVELLRHHYGFRARAYASPDHTSRGGRWPYLSIGYGHSGPDVKEGMSVTAAQASDMLALDLANVEAMVSAAVPGIGGHKLDALCCLAYAIKPPAFRASLVVQALVGGDEENALGHWLDLIYAGGAPHAAIAAQRRAEVSLYSSGEWDDREALPAVVDVDDAVMALQPGMRDPMIMDLHEALAAAGHPTTCGDAYTWVTAEAVKSFQAAHGLPPTGIYDRATAAKLAAVLE